MIKQVITYFLGIQTSIDPVWWSCRYRDMSVYVRENPKRKKNTGCMSVGQYPFDARSFIRRYSHDEFLKEVAKELIKSNMCNEVFVNKFFKDFIMEQQPKPKKGQLSLFD